MLKPSDIRIEVTVAIKLHFLKPPETETAREERDIAQRLLDVTAEAVAHQLKTQAQQKLDEAYTEQQAAHTRGTH